MRMARHGNKMLREPPAILLTDLAFNLLIFFVVCASTEPDTGRKQDVPSGSEDQKNAATDQTINVRLGRKSLSINQQVQDEADMEVKIKELLADKKTPEQRLVVIRSEPDTPYQRWISITGKIERAGGIIVIDVAGEDDE